MGLRSVPPAELAGRRLGAQCLRELREAWANTDLVSVPESDTMDALLEHEPEVLRHCLEVARERGPDCERGFLAVLAEFLGDHMQDFPDEMLQRRYEEGPKLRALDS